MSDKRKIEIELEGEDPNIIVSESEYKGHPMINLVYMGSGRPTTIQFGTGKAKVILNSLKAIEAFYNKNKERLNQSNGQ